MLFTIKHSKIERHRKVENKSMRKVISGKYQNKTSIAILISGKMYFMAKPNHYQYKRDHYIMFKGTVNLDGIILVGT